METRFLRKAQVAARYGVNIRTVERMTIDGRLPAPTHRGRFPLWRESDLDASNRAAAHLPRPPSATAATPTPSPAPQHSDATKNQRRDSRSRRLAEVRSSGRTPP